MERRHPDDERGAAAVEFALIALIMITLMASVIQFAIFFWGYQSASSAAREAARFGAVQPCDTAAIQARGTLRVNESAPVADDSAVITVTQPGTMQVGEPLQVTVEFTTLDINIVPGFTGAVSKSATTRIENIPAGGC